MLQPVSIARFSLKNCALGVLVASGLSLAARAESESAFTADQLEFFERKVRPVLADNCYSCHSHSGEKLKGNLYLDSRADTLKGGDTGPALTVGHPEKSLLVEAVTYSNPDLQMPPKTRLTSAQVEDLKEWVRQGAPWPQEQLKVTTRKGFDLQKRKEEHWCWQPVKSACAPPVTDTQWPIVGADHFILARLEAVGLTPAPCAHKTARLRRVTFDLTGLPPTPAEIDAFEHDHSDRAWAAVVDRLLASPRFGERWARHWLDLVRYAETRGHEFDPAIPNAWQYRDYVIRSLNRDVPYNQFVREHIAGDLIPARINADNGANEAILGTGFWFLGEEVHSPVDIRQDEADRLDNRLDVMGKTFLGVTLGCARCHDHKFDAISQADYYSMTGYLVSSGYRQARFESLEIHRQLAADYDAWQKHAGPNLLQAVMRAELENLEVAHAALVGAEQLHDSSALLSEPVLETPVEEHAIAWMRELQAARRDARHPLHGLVEPSQLTARSTPAASAGLPETNFLSVLDYGSCGSAPWLQDGYSFGSAPAGPGEPLIGRTVIQPLLGLSTCGAAWRRPFWNGLQVEGAERDSGRLGEWERGEQTLRSPEFRLARKKVWYLVRGAGRAYATVDSHLMVVGPLHGALLTEWRTPADRWTWVQHDLRDYDGHRLHVEFSPVGQEPLGIAQIVQGDSCPPLPPDSNEPALPVLGSLPDRVQLLVRQTAEKLIADPSSSGVSWEIADWMVRNLDLLCPPDSLARNRLTAEVSPWMAEQDELEHRIRLHSATAPAMFEGSGFDENLLIRGASRHPGVLTPRRFLEAIAGTHQPSVKRGSGRLDLADQVIDPANPLTSRVIVNRVWHHLFGRGLVATVDNFGVLGERPTHPELLDYLADRFIHEQGWSVKALIRELVLSQAYQMSSRPDDARAEETDPQNLLLHRMNVRRLEGEAIRDALLAVSGRLDVRQGGPGVPVYLNAFMDGRGRPGQSGPLDGDGRRSIYLAIRRNFLNPMMLAFDTPIPFNAMGRRNVSNVPAQALMMMNDPFVVQQAGHWVQHQSPDLCPADRIRTMYQTAFGRLPTESELASATAFIEAEAGNYGASGERDPRVWADLGHVLFNVKEFIYLN